MDKPTKRRTGKIPRKMTPEHLAWGRELGHATNTPVDDIDDEPTDQDYQDFLALGDECDDIADELDTVTDPDGPNVAEAKRLADQRDLIAKALHFNEPDKARVALAALKLMVVSIGKEIVERKRKLSVLKLQLADLKDLRE